jgi:hypothetical protein
MNFYIKLYKLHKGLHNQTMENQLKQIQDKYINSIKSEIDKFTNDITKFNENKKRELIGKDLFDYSTLNLIGIKVNVNNNNIKNISNFYKLLDGESYIASKIWSPNTNKSYYTLITNYSTIIEITNNLEKPQSIICLEFWLPIDYIQIISSLFNVSGRCNTSPIPNYIKLIKHLKTNIENGFYVKNNIDIKNMDVYKYDKEVKKKKIEIDEKETIVLKREKELIKIAKKIKIKEHQLKNKIIKFEKEKEIFEKDKNIFETIKRYIK